MSYQSWYYFLSIEKDFAATIDFVHLDKGNSGAFSNEYAKLILLLGSETDVVAKMLCNSIDPTKKVANIDEYREVIIQRFPGMYSVEIEIAKFGMKVMPWSSWDSAIGRSPDWWRAYNAVKHERDKKFFEANQENTLGSLCGLLVLLLYYYKDEQNLQPYPELLDYGFPGYLLTSGMKKLPGA